MYESLSTTLQCIGFGDDQRSTVSRCVKIIRIDDRSLLQQFK